MRLLYTALVWLAAAAHFAFLVYLPSGGFLALRWRRSIVAHIVAVLWGTGAALGALGCPLTALERWARVRAQMTPMNPGGFIEHYLTGHVWPRDATTAVEIAASTAVGVSWIAYALTSQARECPRGDLNPHAR